LRHPDGVRSVKGIVTIYCKAFLAGDLRRFPGWTPRQARNGAATAGALESEADLPDPIYYLHDNFVVTDSASRTKNVVFDRITPEWIEFCKIRLAFAVSDVD
jgi:hypothetical protein